MAKEVIVRGHKVQIGMGMKVDKRTLEIRKNQNESKGKGYIADICPICKKDIEVDNNVLIVINNYKLFPNVFVHKDCIETKTEEELIEIMENLTDEYEKAKELMKIWL